MTLSAVSQGFSRSGRSAASWRLPGALTCAVFALLAAFTGAEALAQSDWDRRVTRDSRSRIDEVSARQYQYDEDGTVRRTASSEQTSGYDYPGYFSFYLWYGEIDPTSSPGQNAWGGGFRFAWPGQIRYLMSIDGGTFTDRSFLDAQFARLFPLGVEADLHFGFSDDIGLSLVAGLQAGMSMINYDFKAIKYISIYAGFDGFVGLRMHFGPVFVGADFMIGPQFFIHQWHYDEDEDATLPSTPPTENRIWIGGTLLVGFKFG